MAQPRPCDPRHYRAVRDVLEEMGATRVRYEAGGKHGRACYIDPLGVARFETIAHGFSEGRTWRGHIKARLARQWGLTAAHRYA